MEFLIINGTILRKEEANVTPFFWDEPLLISRKIWFGYGGIPLLHENAAILIQQLKQLKVPVHDLLLNQRELYRITKRMLNKNKYYRSGWLHLQLFVGKTALNLSITSHAVSTFDFPVRTSGIMAHFTPIPGDTNPVFNQFSFIQHAKARAGEAANPLFINKDGMLCDAGSANIYLLKNKTLYTPSANTGCYIDLLRPKLLEIAVETGYMVEETDHLRMEDVVTMNEIFLLGEENGFQWILGLENKRFMKNAVLTFHQEINRWLQQKAD